MTKMIGATHCGGMEMTVSMVESPVVVAIEHGTGGEWDRLGGGRELAAFKEQSIVKGLLAGLAGIFIRFDDDFPLSRKRIGQKCSPSGLLGGEQC